MVLPAINEAGDEEDPSLTDDELLIVFEIFRDGTVDLYWSRY